jgi:hypothetical protein
MKKPVEQEPKPNKPGPKPETLSLYPLNPKQATRIFLRSKPAQMSARQR